MMRHDQSWATSRSQVQRKSDLRFVKTALAALDISTDAGGPVAPAGQLPTVGNALADLTAVTPAQPAADFVALATHLLKTFDDDAKWLNRMVMALRRSERDALWPGLRPTSTTITARFGQLARSARWSLYPSKLAELVEEAGDQRTWWQISYNAACGYASQVTSPIAPNADANASTALDLLEQTLLRPGAQQLDAAWVGSDPDLASLRRSERFKNFVKQLRPGA